MATGPSACMDLTEVVFRVLPFCRRSRSSKRLKSSFELFKLKVELLYNVRDTLEEQIAGEVMLGKKPAEESRIWLARVEEIKPQVRDILNLEQNVSRFDASLHERLMNLLNEIVICLEKSPLELAPSVEKKFDTETAKRKMMQPEETEAQTVSVAGIGSSMPPGLSDELESKREMTSFSEIVPASSIESAAIPENIRHRRTEILYPRETETDIVSSASLEADHVVKISTEPTLPLGIYISGPLSSTDDILHTEQAALQLHCHHQAEGDPVRPESRTTVKRSIQHTLQDILNCINDVKSRRIGIYGTGGIGKTTVLKALINCPEVKYMFDLIIWVTVSRYWSTRKIQTQIVRQLALNNADSDSETAEQLFKFLRGRRFLLALDDVWDCVDLDAVGIPYSSEEVICRIIISTRSPEVCHIMATDREIEVEGLSSEEAWRLFHEQLGNIIYSPNIHDFARLIVDKCGGLPLAIVVTGRALRDEDNAMVWMHASREFSQSSTAGLHGTEAVIQQLKFSYERLRAQEIKCLFLYCALFPEDHEINISALIEYCIQDGLVAGDLEDARKKGHNIVELLVNAALLERTRDGISVKMHDVIRDLALGVISTDAIGSQFLVGADLRLTQLPSIGNTSISRSLESSYTNNLLLSEGHQFLLRAGVELTEPLTEKELENAKMVCLMDSNLSALPEAPSCPNLLTLSLRRNSLLREIPMLFFDSMPSLQVLNLSETKIRSLPLTITKLKSLQAIILRNCELLAMLPPEIGLLNKLEVLDLHGTLIIQLPVDICKLVLLKQLKVSFYGSYDQSENAKLPLELIPHAIISNLLELEKLSVVVYPGDKRWRGSSVESIILKVGSLTKLIDLCFYFPDVELLNLFLQMSPSWKGNGSLKKFNFIVGDDVKRIVARVPEDVALDFGRRGQCLRFVNGDMIPEAVVEVLTRATALYLDNHLSIGSLSEFGLDCINRLEFCVVRECHQMHTIIDGRNIAIAALPSLERLSVHYMWNLRKLWGDRMPSGSFAKLKVLTVHKCPVLSFIFSCSMLQCVPNLEELEVEDCPAIKEILSQDTLIISSGSILPSLKRLTLHYLPELVNIWKGPWPLLERISFYKCSNLKNIGMDNNLKHTLKEIKAEKNWWDALQWEDTALFLHVEARFNQITDEDL